jgi:hypothetical protein
VSDEEEDAGRRMNMFLEKKNIKPTNQPSIKYILELYFK